MVDLSSYKDKTIRNIYEKDGWLKIETTDNCYLSMLLAEPVLLELHSLKEKIKKLVNE